MLQYNSFPYCVSHQVLANKKTTNKTLEVELRLNKTWKADMHSFTNFALHAASLACLIFSSNRRPSAILVILVSSRFDLVSDYSKHALMQTDEKLKQKRDLQNISSPIKDNDDFNFEWLKF